MDKPSAYPPAYQPEPTAQQVAAALMLTRYYDADPNFLRRRLNAGDRERVEARVRAVLRG